MVIIKLTEEEYDTLTTIVSEFCDSIDNRRDKDGNYKNKVWKDCLDLGDILHDKIYK